MRDSAPAFFIPIKHINRAIDQTMQANQKVIPIHSDGYEELMSFCRNLTAPYTEHDVRAFNAIYRCIYQELSREERRRAERLVDLMIDGLESLELASLIYGVV